MPPRKKQDASTPDSGASRSKTADIRANFLKTAKSLDDSSHKILSMDVEEPMFPSGLIVLDEVCRIGGIPFNGRIMLAYGWEHGGKSSLSYSIVKSYQQFTGEPAVIFDFERTGTAKYLKDIGLDTSADMLQVRRPDSIQECTKEMIEFLQAGVRFFVCDSIPRMKSKKDLKEIRTGKAFKATYGGNAKDLSSHFYDIILPYLAEKNASCLMINQVRDRLDGTQEAEMAKKYRSFTNIAYSLPGGHAPRFTSSLSFELKAKKAHKGCKEDPFLFEPEPKNATEIVVTEHELRIMKNKVTGGGYRIARLWNRPGKGFDDWISVREYARNYGLIEYKGKKWVVGENPVIVEYDSKEEAIHNLVIEPDMEVLAKLREQVVQAIRNDTSGANTFTLSDEEKAWAEGADASDDDESTSVVNMDDIDDLD